MKTIRQLALPLLITGNLVTALVAYDSIQSKQELHREMERRIQEVEEEKNLCIKGKDAKLRVLENRIEEMRIRPRTTTAMTIKGASPHGNAQVP